MAVQISLRPPTGETWRGSLKSRYVSKDGYTYRLTRTKAKNRLAKTEQPGDWIIEGHWVTATCDGDCERAEAKHPKSDNGNRPASSDNKNPWCIFQCSRATVYPLTPAEGPLAIVVSLGTMENWSGTLGTEFDSKDGYRYKVMCKRTKGGKRR